MKLLACPVLTAALLYGSLAVAQDAAPTFEDGFAGEADRWEPYFDEGQWSVREGMLRSTSRGDSVRLAKLPPGKNAVIEAEVRVGASGRTNFGVVLRARPDHSFLMVRFYDGGGVLQLVRFDKGRASTVAGGQRVSLERDRWYHIKVAAIDDMLLGKLWPASDTEPDWQLRRRTALQSAGRVGLTGQDRSVIDFRAVRIWSGTAVEGLRASLAQARAAREKHVREVLQLRLESTPFVHRTENGPMRRISLRTVADGEPEPVGGKIKAVSGAWSRTYTVTPSDLDDGTYALLVPEPNASTRLEVVFDTSIKNRLESQLDVRPARHWTFYMTPHTHYDIGYTHPQPEVIERLSDDMDLAVQYCDETADWPAESRYRWTVEVSALVKNYIDRHSSDQVARLMELAKAGRIEICGSYLNMPTELVGHEELIRCLYYTRELRDRYGVPIDTVMIDDVPGYAWALPELFVESGITRAAFRANSIHAQFLWYRSGAVPRPFYWQGPEGSRVFVWYTDSYREGNFFRSPGLHEGSFLNIIRRNEQAGATVDDIQLRMGGDNLPPDIDASRNARAWNAKYVWPKVVVATNREYLETLEKRHGKHCETHRGDIPSWWAEGPASSAHETGMNRLVHDKLTAAETLWSLAWLSDKSTKYPRDEINRAYDDMIHFDEHTWGASGSVRDPHSANTVSQWKWKAECAQRAHKLTSELHGRALAQLSEPPPSGEANGVVVWNTLAWPRTDVVALPLTDGPFRGVGALEITDDRTGKPVASQTAKDGATAYFVAQDVPGFGYVRFEVKRAERNAAPTDNDTGATVENRFYRIVIDRESGGWSSWYDYKERGAELIDGQAPYGLNQAIFETPLGGTDKAIRGRDVIERKRPVQFKRTAARGGRLVSVRRGPVFTDVTTEVTLPTCPRILQTVRLYRDFKAIDLINVIDKEENFEPEGVYFAFPFAIPSPEFHVEIADAVMRPGKDQLALTCHDFYSIQHWANVGNHDFGVVLAPLEAPVISVSDLNVYKWADRIEFDKSHLYSLAMNNYWYTNFKGGQSGTLTFRYRLTSYVGRYDAGRATRFAWQPFQPLVAVPMSDGAGKQVAPSGSWLEVEGDPVAVSCLKVAEAEDALIVRMLEQRGRRARCTLRPTLPGNRRIATAFVATVLETRRGSLDLSEGSVTVELRPNEIATIGFVPTAP